MLNTETHEQSSIMFSKNSRWLTICLVVMFLLAALIRRDDIKAPGFAPTKEYISAIISRAFYFAGNDNIAPWRQDIAIINKDQQPILEPPLTEYLVSLIYQLMGNEEIWYARYLTSFFWLIGGIFMYKITRILVSVDVAFFATAYYLFIPMSIKVSRSFQPEALMMMMYLISLYFIIKYFEIPTTKNLILSAILAGVAILIKPLVIFVIYSTFVAISIHKKRKLSRVIDWPLIVFLGISFVLPFIYYGYGVFIANLMRWNVAHIFLPHLFTHWQYWEGWFDTGVAVVSHPAFIFALLGFFLMQKSLARTLVIGLVFGYFIFGLAFNYHIMTHSYYHIQVLPIIGICAAIFFVNAITTIKRIGKHFWMPVILVLFFGLYFSFIEVRNSLYISVFETPNIAKEIGEIVNHSPRVVTVAYEYGIPLTYYGEFSGTWWPNKIESELYRSPDDKELSVQERLDLISFRPEYFVITDFDRYNRNHQDLNSYLENNCSLNARSGYYLIYNNC